MGPDRVEFAAQPDCNGSTVVTVVFVWLQLILMDRWCCVPSVLLSERGTLAVEWSMICTDCLICTLECKHIEDDSTAQDVRMEHDVTCHYMCHKIHREARKLDQVFLSFTFIGNRNTSKHHHDV